MSDIKFERLEDHPEIGLLTLDAEGKRANILTTPFRDEFAAILEKLKKEDGLKALLIESAKDKIFIAGADISEIQNIKDSKDAEDKARSGQDLMNALEDLPFATVAVIHGACVGGGLELSMACTWRFASYDKSTQIGLPEVKLGIIPGFGGTWRLPRLAGLQKGLGLVIQGKITDAKGAYRNGLIDGIFPRALLRQAAVEHVIKTQYTTRRPFYKPKNLMMKVMEKTSFGKSIMRSQAKKLTLKATKGKYPAPITAIDVVIDNFDKTRSAAMKNESKHFGSLAEIGQHRTLTEIFFLTERYKKESWVESKPLPVNKAAVLGAGVMGGGIAQALTSRSIPVRLKDVGHEALSLGLKSSAEVYKKAVKRRKFNRAQAATLQGLILPSLDYSGFKTCDLVIEAVVENMDIKKKVFAELDEVTRPDTVLASNTSSLSVSEMAAAVKDPSRVVGMHFFNPVHRMPLVEIIRGKETSDAAVATIVDLSRKLGKTPVVVRDAPGFLVNRLLMPFLNEAAYLASEGADIKKVDRVLFDFGMPMGAFVLLDEIGLDVAQKVGVILEDAFGARMKACDLSKKMTDQKWLGRKNGIGFYQHSERHRVINPNLSKVADQNNEFSHDQVVSRCLYVMVNEAAYCLQEKVCREAADVDIAMLMGTGFPPFRGGLLSWADRTGLDNIVESLNALSQSVDAERFKPCALLTELASGGKTFHGM